MSLEQATIKMHNPLEATPENLANGKQQFETYCAPCHGSSGQGDGPVAHLLAKAPKSLIADTSKDLPDGYIYGVIRDGAGSMPSYAEEMPVDQRWQVVMYLRSMQSARLPKSQSRRQLNPPSRLIDPASMHCNAVDPEGAFGRRFKPV